MKEFYILSDPSLHSSHKPNNRSVCTLHNSGYISPIGNRSYAYYCSRGKLLKIKIKL